MPYRPLELGIISTNQAKVLALIYYLISIIISLLFSYLLLFGVLFFSLFTYLYSVKPFRLVSRGFLAYLSLSTVSIFIPMITGYFTAKNLFSIEEDILLVIVSITLFFSFFIILKDFKDFLGDSKTGKNTFVVKYGVSNASKIMFVGSTVTFLMSVFFVSGIITNSNLYFFISLLFILAILKLQYRIIKEDYNPNTSDKIFSSSRLLFFLYSIALLILLVY